MARAQPAPGPSGARSARAGLGRRLAARTIIAAAGLALLGLSLANLQYPWDWSVLWRYRDLYIDGFGMTVALSLGAMALGLLIGLCGGLARVSESVFLNELAGLYVEVFRGTPLLVQIYIFYFCLAAVLRFDNALVIGAVTLACFSGAYITEMVRAGIQSVEDGQWEAALATGLTRSQTLRAVILPQALRRVVPPIAGQFVSLIKDSSLLSVISVRELTKASEVVNATTYKTFEAYLPLAAFYLILTWPLTLLTYALEKRMYAEKQDRTASGHGRIKEEFHE